MKKYTLALIVFSLLAFIACTQAPELKTYSLETPQIAKIYSSHTKNKVLKISYPQNLFESMSEKMHFSYSLDDRGTYLNSQWSSPINRLLQGTLIAFLAKNKQFKAVLSDNSAVLEDYKLESHIFAFEHRVRGEESFAIVSIEFVLIDVKQGRLLKNKRFSYQQRTQTIDAKGYAKATNVIISRLARDLLGWLRFIYLTNK